MRRFASLLLITAAGVLPGWAGAQMTGPIGAPPHADAGLASLVIGVAVMVLLIAIQKPRDTAGCLLGLLMLCWAIPRTLEAPLPTGARLLLTHALVCMGLLILLRSFQLRVRAVLALWFMQGLLVPVSLVPLAAPGRTVESLWHGVLLVELLTVAAWVLWQQHRSAEVAKPALGGAPSGQRSGPNALPWLLILAIAMDLARPGWSALVPAAWVHAAGLVLPLVLMACGADKAIASARAVTAAQASALQSKLDMQKHLAEIERSHARLAEERLEQVTERERKRIAADLHDDLGAKLLTIVHTSESDRISTLAREALEEMRLSVRGLSGRPVQLIDALGDWRAEVVSRLGQANILAEWRSPAEDIEHTLQARSYVQTTRILRESVSNIIKHSGATSAIISCSVQEGDFVLKIQDNGRGISSEQEGRLDRGHGMVSMKSRAKQMQGQCLVESGPGWGTLIRLTLPLKHS